MKNNTKDVLGYRISQLDRPFDLKPNQATKYISHMPLFQDIHEILVSLKGNREVLYYYFC